MDWTDEDGVPLGDWVQIDRDRYAEIFTAADARDRLIVFASLTDPDGQYGPRQIYTAWGHRGQDAPLLDATDYVGGEYGTTRKQVYRQFVRTDPAEKRA